MKFLKEPILVVFAHEVDKIGKDAIRSMIKMMTNYSNAHDGDKSYKECLNGILIVGGTVTAIAKKVSKRFLKPNLGNGYDRTFPY